MASMNFTLSHKRLKELLHYNLDTGLFTCIKLRGNCEVGSVADSLDGNGYVKIGIDYRTYRAHRLAWFYVTGTWAEYDVDHRDGVHNNNVWTNLRETTRIVNMQNQRSARAGSKTGILGVSEDKGKFRAQICVNKKRMHIGNYDTKEAANAAYLEAKRQLHPGCTI